MKSTFANDMELVIGAAKGGSENLKLPFRITTETGATKIETLDLSQRASNALKRSQINTIGDIVDSFSTLKKFRNVGTITIREIRRKTADFLYEAMSVADRKAFWREFISLNNIEGLSAK